MWEYSDPRTHHLTEEKAEAEAAKWRNRKMVAEALPPGTKIPKRVVEQEKIRAMATADREFDKLSDEESVDDPRQQTLIAKEET